MKKAAVIAFLAAVSAAVAAASHAGVRPGPSPVTTVMSRVAATGRGRAPERGMSAPQKRLMAKRAAMVEAYKKLAEAVGDARSYMADGTGYTTVSGFIRGTEITETRYYPNGDVEVDLEMAIPTLGGPRVISRGHGGGGSPVSVSAERRTISEAEWRRIFGGTPP